MKISPVRLTLVIGGVCLLALAAIGWFVVLSPRLATASQVTEQADQLDAANLQLRVQYQKALALAEQAPAAAADAQRLFATMPEQADLPVVLDQIAEAATSAGIDPRNIEVITTSVPIPIPAAKGSAGSAVNAGINLASMEVSVSAKGKRREILKFIDNLQGLDRALLLTMTGITDSEGVGTGPTESVQVTGSMFVLQSRLPDLVANVEQLIADANLTTGDAGTDEAPTDGTATPAP